MLFPDFTSEEKTLFEAIGKCRQFNPGDMIIREDETGESMFVVQQGTLEVRKHLDQQNYKHLKELREGDFFGETAFMGIASRTATVIAIEACQVLEIPFAAFEALICKHPVIGIKVYKNMARELALRLKHNTDELKKALLWALQNIEE